VEADALDISTACDKEGNPLVYHAYLAQRPRSRLLYSVSLFRAGRILNVETCSGVPIAIYIGKICCVLNKLDILNTTGADGVPIKAM
jgi:hypothetical protein